MVGALTTMMAAEYVGLAPQTMAKLRCIGGSPPFYKLGRKVVYKKHDLDDWMHQRRRASTSDLGNNSSRA